MKILITGSTAQQASARTATRVPTFASMMAESLSREGNEVSFVEPSFALNKQYLSEYDIVLVGIAPPTSLSANKVYPAFAMANRARELGNLAVFIDAPDPYKIPASIKSCYLNVSDLHKEFYSRRKEYRLFAADKKMSEEVYQFVEYLNRNVWPVTFYPAFPWSNPLAITSVIPNIEEEKLFGINLDYQIFEESQEIETAESSENYWVADYLKSKWTQLMAAGLQLPVAPAREKWDSREQILRNMTNSVGTLISVHRSMEPWWSPFAAMSLSLGRPAITDWRYSSEIGSPWGFLASTVEGMSLTEREHLAEAQREGYQTHIEPLKKNLVRGLNKAASQAYFLYN